MTLERDTVLAGVAEELRGFCALVRSLDDGALDVSTRCAGWTVRDVAGHVVGTVVDVAGGKIEGQGTPTVTERQARERKGATPAQLADELDAALPALSSLLDSLPAEAWDGPSLLDPALTLGFSVEALWYDAYVHGEDVRAALGLPPTRGSGLRCAVHHVAGYLAQRGSSTMTLVLDGLESVQVRGGGMEVSGDPLDFVLAATGRLDPTTLGLEPSINVYGDF
jgi:uncharacterized protein (TIGR03083 family)